MSNTSEASVAVVTGASSGMGLETAKALAARGWHVIAHGRDAGRSETAKAAIRACQAAGGKTDFIRADLALVSEALDVAAQIERLTDRVDCLINNAGGVRDAMIITAEGNEATFAGNHLGHFALTDRLLPLLQKSAASRPAGSTRVINVASSAHEYTTQLHWDDLQSIDNFDPNAAYCTAKLANVLFTTELAHRLSGTGIVVHAMHPGTVATAFFSHGDARMQQAAHTSTLIKAEDGADTIIWLATAQEPATCTGEYWYERHIISTNPLARDRQVTERFWLESEKMIGTSLKADFKARVPA